MRVLDLFCGAGGAAVGYAEAGFEVVGVDLFPQPHFPYEFIQGDALTFPLEGFDLIHASPVCKAYSVSRHKATTKLDHPKQIDAVRDRLIASGIPYIIENVPGAPLRNPTMLCGSMFGLGVRRHRLFESNLPLSAPAPCGSHQNIISVFGHDSKRVVNGQRIGLGVQAARDAMGIQWMTGNELSQAIPPAYTKWLGNQARTLLLRAA